MSELTVSSEAQSKVVPSAAYNNLATAGGLFVYGSKKEAVLVKAQSVRLLTHADSKKRGFVTHVAAKQVGGKLLAAVAAGSAVEIWDLGKELLVSTMPVDGTVRCVAIGNSADGGLLVLGMESGEVVFVTVADSSHPVVAGRSRVHTKPVTCLALGEGAGHLVVSGDIDGTVVVWNAQRASAFTIPPRQADCVTAVAMDGTNIIATFGGGKVRIFAAASAELTVEIAAHARWINAAAYDSSSKQLATCASDGMLCVWQLPTGASSEVSLAAQRFTKNALWTGVAIPSSGQLVACSYDNDRITTFSY